MTPDRGSQMETQGQTAEVRGPHAPIIDAFGRPKLRPNENGSWFHRSHFEHIKMRLKSKADELARSDTEIARLISERDAQSAQIATLQAEVERLREERKAADHRLVDRYRNPTTGMFSFPDDVAAIILALDKAETDRNAAIARAEAAARKGEAG